jgi:hypothetical protein
MRTIALASPLVWFANHAAQFALAPLACLWKSNLILWIVFIAALVLDAACGAVAWNAWRRAPSSGSGQEAAAAEAGIMPPWLAISGVSLSIAFFIIITAQMIPTLILGWCA